jgi:hypothetical protein
MRAVWRLLIILLVLFLLLVVADRVAAWAGQRAVAEQVATGLSQYQVDSEPPEVSFDRAPFLTQVARGSYESVTLRLRDVGAGELRAPLVELTATGVTASVRTLLERDGPIHAERIEGTATVGYDMVVRQAGLENLDLSAAGNGQLRVQVPADVLGTSVTLAGQAEVAAVDGAVSLQVTELTVQEPAQPPPGIEALIPQLVAQLSVTVPLPPLPYGLVVESVRAEPAGLVVRVSAQDVPLAR